MKTVDLPNRTYSVKKSLHARMINLALLAAIFLLAIFALILFLSGYTSYLYLPILAVVTLLAVFSYYIKVPPPYARLEKGVIYVRQNMLGRWRSLPLELLEVVEPRGERLYLAASGSSGGEIELNLEAMQDKDARELKDLLLKTISSKP